MKTYERGQALLLTGSVYSLISLDELLSLITQETRFIPEGEEVKLILVDGDRQRPAWMKRDDAHEIIMGKLFG